MRGGNVDDPDIRNPSACAVFSKPFCLWGFFKTPLPVRLCQNPSACEAFPKPLCLWGFFKIPLPVGPFKTYLPVKLFQNPSPCEGFQSYIHEASHTLSSMSYFRKPSVYHALSAKLNEYVSKNTLYKEITACRTDQEASACTYVQPHVRLFKTPLPVIVFAIRHICILA